MMMIPSNRSVQIRRQVESRLMEHLLGQSSRVGLRMGSNNTGMCLFWSGRLGAGICALRSCGFWVWADLQQGLCQQDCSWLCTQCRTCLMFSWTAGFLAGAEPPGQKHLRWGLSDEGCGGMTLQLCDHRTAPSPQPRPHNFSPPPSNFAKHKEYVVFLHGVRLCFTNGHWHQPSPLWTSNVADRDPTPQMRTLALYAQGFCSSVSWHLMLASLQVLALFPFALAAVDLGNLRVALTLT